MFKIGGLLLLMLWFCAGVVWGQAPVISYVSPQTYTKSTPIIKLTPINTGGAVPATVYGTVSTFAGSIQGSQDGVGNVAKFYSPTDVKADANGNIYVADNNINKLRKITPDGTVSTLSANPEGTTDGPLATARFKSIYKLGGDNAGNIYVSDATGFTLRKIDQAGFVSTYAGNGANGFVNSNISAFAQFGYITSTAFDATNNMYVADLSNHVIRKVTLAGVVTTYAGSGANGAANGPGLMATFANPSDVVVDAGGNVFVTDKNGSGGTIRKIALDRTVSTLAGAGAGNTDGLGTAASFSTPEAITIDPTGNLYVADGLNSSIRMITSQGLVSTVAGSGTKGMVDAVGKAAKFALPSGIEFYKGELYVADNENFLIRKIVVTGYTIDKPLPAGLNFDVTNGDISGTPTVTSPLTDYTITAFNAAGSSSSTIKIKVEDVSTPPVTPPTVAAPIIKYDPQTKTFYKDQTIPTPYYAPINTGGAVPATLYGDVTTITDSNNPGNAFGNPVNVAVDNSNNIYVADYGTNQVKKITRNTTVPPYSYTITAMGVSFNHPKAVAFDALDNLYVADQDGSVILKVAAGSGMVSTYAGTPTAGYLDGPAATAQFNQISGMATDISGNLYIADTGNGKIRKVTPAGVVSTLLSGLNKPTNLNLDATGNIYFAEYGTHTIKYLDITTGQAMPYTGTGSPGNADGQRAVASFNNPYGLTRDPTNNVYITDEKNYTIRRSGVNEGTVVIVAGNNTAGNADGLYTVARFTQPGSIAFDRLGNLVLTDNNSVRNIVATGYTISGGSGKLPAGLIFDYKTGVFSGTPSQLWPLTEYTITAYNAGGSSNAFPVNIEVVPLELKLDLPIKTNCDIGTSFDPGGTSTFGAVTYINSSNPSVATIVNNKILINALGNTTITATDGKTTVTKTLSVIQQTPVSVTISKTSVNNCEGIQTEYQAGALNAGAHPFYKWEVDGVEMNNNNPIFSSATLKQGQELKCTVTNTDCPSTKSTTLIINLLPIRNFTSRIQSSVTGGVCPGTPVTYTVLPQNSVQQSGYQWQVNGVNAGSNNPAFTSNSLKNGDRVTCIVSSISACLSNTMATSNEIMAEILPDGDCVIKIPNTFTPNGDGYNDTWQLNLPGAVSFKVTAVKIYDRSGGLVYQSAGYDKPWDGCMNGKALPVATYYYIIESEDRKRISGNVTIIR